MDFRKLREDAKQAFEQRGGSDRVKRDAQRLKEIARSEGSLGDKRKRAMDALKEPGADGSGAPGQATEPSSAAEPGSPASGDSGSDSQTTREGGATGGQ